MAQVITMPARKSGIQYKDRLKTQGERFSVMERKLVDQAEFYEAMILVLDDVRLQNIRKRDYAMMDIIAEEIPRYQKRLDEVKDMLDKLRAEFQMQQVAAN
ncbi:MAG: hypothetical protein P9L94_09090 [Candidatus Hinthialibacter antarcticus]|nr:hypothetical protein [Candidatus Hinthialibacter antarcticus]